MAKLGLDDILVPFILHEPPRSNVFVVFRVPHCGFIGCYGHGFQSDYEIVWDYQVLSGGNSHENVKGDIL